MADQDKKYSEESTSETKTKEGFMGGPVRDSAGETVKETTTKTEGHEESSDNGDGGDDD